MGNLAAARSNVVTAARLSPPPEIELFDLRLRVEGKKEERKNWEEI